MIELELVLELGIYLDSQLDRTCWGYRLWPPNESENENENELGREVVAPWSAGCDVDSPSLTAQMHQAAQNARGSNPLPEGQGTPAIPLRILVPLIVACALFMENLDATVLSTALPAIANDLHQSPIQLKLALTSYLLTLAVFIPASGWVADRFGTRIVFRLAILIFAIGSALCGFANSIGDAGGSQGFSGNWRRDDGAGRASGDLKDHSTLRVGGSAGLVDHAGAAWTGDGSACRRFHHHLFPLALDLLDQFTDGGSRDDARHPLHPQCARRNHHQVRLFGLRLVRGRTGRLSLCIRGLGRFRCATLDCRRPVCARCHFGKPLCSARSPSGIAYSGFETLEISNLQGRNRRGFAFSHWCRSDAVITAVAASARIWDDSA